MPKETSGSDAPGRSGLTAPPPYKRHQGESRKYVRDLVLAGNDGLVSIFLLVAGVVGGGFATGNVLLAGLAGAIAGAVSMAAGEYLATKSQEDVLAGEIELEREHIAHYRKFEMTELRVMLADLGLEAAELDRVVAAVEGDDEVLLRFMTALEFGVLDANKRSPEVAMMISGAAFVVGSLPPLIPFVLATTASRGLFYSAIGSGIALFALGATKARVARGNRLVGGVENLLVAIIGAGISYSAGRLYEALVA